MFGSPLPQMREDTLPDRKEGFLAAPSNEFIQEREGDVKPSDKQEDLYIWAGPPCTESMARTHAQVMNSVTTGSS